ncbi:MAG: hypothetical protein K0S18_826 [Anaerocolumna sp.]|jgi:hypothetical protein|nr:hypothetical protein [Anaerocolumna sp.]
MDIAGISNVLNQGQAMTNVNVAVLSKNLDTIETLGDSMIQMMEKSVTPNLGQNIDVKL